MANSSDSPWGYRLSFAFFALAPVAALIWRSFAMLQLQTAPYLSSWDGVLWLWCGFGWLAWCAAVADWRPAVLVAILANPVAVPLWMRWTDTIANRRIEVLLAEQGQTAMAWVAWNEHFSEYRGKTGTRAAFTRTTVTYPTPDSPNHLTERLDPMGREDLSDEVIAPYRAATGGHAAKAYGRIRYVPERPWLYHWVSAQPLRTEVMRWMWIGGIGHLVVAGLTALGLLGWSARRYLAQTRLQRLP